LLEKNNFTQRTGRPSALVGRVSLSMDNLKVCILDYGSGNVRSVFNVFSILTEAVFISNKPEDVISATHLVLPGVGAFGASMKKIQERIPLTVLENEALVKNKPFLGICVGMQILADTGLEFGEHQGLGWIPGTVEKIDSRGLPLPHVGWNNIEIKKETPLLADLGNSPDFYFVHSYAFKEKDTSHVAAKTEYGSEFTAVISKGNIFGVQFHPEKSQKAGKILLKNFLNLR